jgi:plasmid stabilization system protein ParE
MKRVVGLTDRALLEMEAAHDWWAENRSPLQAAKWYNAFADAIESLESHSERCPLSPENGLFPFEIRDYRFGVGRRKTHRAVFTIRPDMVLIVAVKHLAQQYLSPGDI